MSPRQSQADDANAERQRRWRRQRQVHTVTDPVRPVDVPAGTCCRYCGRPIEDGQLVTEGYHAGCVVMLPMNNYGSSIFEE